LTKADRSVEQPLDAWLQPARVDSLQQRPKPRFIDLADTAHG
jgi:hypothetical protein